MSLPGRAFAAGLLLAACGSSDAKPVPPATATAFADGGMATTDSRALRGECRPATTTPIASALCPATCGNGSVDDCSPPCGPELCAPVKEECDDAATAPVACAGYASGTASCHGCLVDPSGCEPCVAGGSTSCTAISGDDHGTIQPAVGAIPESDDVLVAWSVAGAIHVARVRPDGTVAAMRSLDDNCVAYRPAVAATAAGAFVAYFDAEGVKLAALDAGLAPRGAPRLVDDSGWTPVLVSRPTGGPLLVWPSGSDSERSDLYAAVLADDGSEAAPRAQYGKILNDRLAAVQAAGRFYLGFRPLGQGDAEIHVIEGDGTTRKVYDKHLAGAPLLAARGDVVRAFVRDIAFDAKAGDAIVLDGGALGASTRLGSDVVPLAIGIRADGSIATVGGPPSDFGDEQPHGFFVGAAHVVEQPSVTGLVATMTPSGLAVAWTGGLSYSGTLGGDPRRSPIRVARVAP